jgi:predicted amidohydrolase
MPRHLNIACLQTRPQADFRSALDEALPLAETAVQAGADILFLPEYCGGLLEDGPVIAPPAAAEASHPVLDGLRAFAKSRQVWISVGSIAIKAPGGMIINRGYMLDDLGNIRGRYDKIHLFDVKISETESYLESTCVLPGGQAVIFETPFGRIGHTICYDLRFPQLYRELAQAGAEILCVPAAFTKTTGEAHWHVLNRARAIENGAFVVSACAIGPVPGGTETYGHSLVVSPWGEVLADGGTLPGVVQAGIDLDKVAETRARIPSLTHDRPLGGGDARKIVA